MLGLGAIGKHARELHDQTLQSLGALRVRLASALRQGEPASAGQAIRQAIEEIEQEIGNLRGIINDLRPSLLDDLGLVPAIEALLERRREGGLRITSELSLPDSTGNDGALDPELETTAYRVVQEALTNIVKHARASKARVAVGVRDGELILEIQDNGTGFDPGRQVAGFGLAGMRERVYLAGGTFEVESAEPGTIVRARLPLRRAAGREPGSVADQVTS